MSDFASVTCISEKFVSASLKGTYEMKIKNYSQCPKAFGQNIASPIFKLANSEWSLSVYFGGIYENVKHDVSIYLRNEQTDDSEVSASFQFGLVNQKQFSESKLSVNIDRVYEKKGNPGSTWGLISFFKQSLLTDADSPYLLDDTVLLRVEIEVVDKTATKELLQRKVGQTVMSACSELFESGLGSDVSFVFSVANNQEIIDRIPAHKGILMVRSPVFKAMFTHNMSESNTNEIVISDFSPEVIREMLHFMYTDKLQSETLDNTVYEGLLGAAIKYDVPALVNLCESHYLSQLTDENVLSLYKTADRCGSIELKSEIMSYIKRHISSLMDRAEFQPMLENFLVSSVQDNTI